MTRLLKNLQKILLIKYWITIKFYVQIYCIIFKIFIHYLECVYSFPCFFNMPYMRSSTKIYLNLDISMNKFIKKEFGNIIYLFVY